MKMSLRYGLSAVLLGAALLGVAPAARADDGVEVVRAPLPAIALPSDGISGQRAVSALGRRLPDVAAHYGRTPADFQRMLLQDPTLHLDRNAGLYAVDDFGGRPPRPSSSFLARSVIDGTLAPLIKTFFLHSKPDAKRVIELNFKGMTLTGTGWNGSKPAIVAPPFDADGNPKAFSDAELQRIQYIWQRVSEDYAPFNVDVTTEALPQSRISRSGSTDEYYGTMALITNSAAFGSCGCGGVAYIGIFNMTQDNYKPALIFYDTLYSDENFVADAISHEVGHNIGLSHDGNASTEYFGTQGTGVTSWGPIMGAPYHANLSQFSDGDYGGANNHQDDFAVANSYGLPLRADDAGNTPAAAKRLNSTTAANGFAYTSIKGVIESRGDVDIYALSVGAGKISATVVPAARGPDLDLKLSLLNARGAVLVTQNPPDRLDASLTYTVATPGTYYLKVEPAGFGNPLTTGYSTYGVRGNYWLRASSTPAR